MNPEIKKLWVEALRSGKYEQGIGQLYCCRENSYCCLGVLARVSPGDGNWSHEKFCEAEEKNGGVLPKATLFRVGLSENQMRALVELNDSENLTFKEIANWIETEL